MKAVVLISGCPYVPQQAKQGPVSSSAIGESDVDVFKHVLGLGRIFVWLSGHLRKYLLSVGDEAPPYV